MANFVEIQSTINKRYSALSQDDGCCLSCGGAVNYAKAAPGEVCVDLGSGRGTDALRMAEEVGSTGFVYGIDLSDGMIAKATATAQKLGVTNVTFQQAELESLPLENNSANLVISNCVLNHATNKPKVWQEVYRIVKPGGRFVVSDIYSSEPVPAEYRNDPEAVAECWAGADTRDVYMATVEQAGFERIQVLEESKPYPKGKIEVSSFTVIGFKPGKKCCGQ